MKTGLYNGMTLEQIESNLHKNMIPLHREQYLNNCKEVIRNEEAGFNLDYCQAIRNTNFNLTVFYLNS